MTLAMIFQDLAQQQNGIKRKILWHETDGLRTEPDRGNGEPTQNAFKSKQLPWIWTVPLELWTALLHGEKNSAFETPYCHVHFGQIAATFQD